MEEYKVLAVCTTEHGMYRMYVNSIIIRSKCCQDATGVYTHPSVLYSRMEAVIRVLNNVGKRGKIVLFNSQFNLHLTGDVKHIITRRELSYYVIRTHTHTHAHI